MDVERTLFGAVADALSDWLARDVSADDVAEALERRYGVPSDGFWAAWDLEVGNLMDRYLANRAPTSDECDSEASS
jgi:hypothetical protein